MLIKGKSMWAFVTQPNTNFKPAKYEITVVLSDEDADALQRDGYNVRDKEEGRVINIKRWLVNKNTGQPNAVPRLVDSDKNELDIRVGNGSDVTVQGRPWEVTNEFGHHKGFDLQAVQVDKLIPYEGLAPDGEELGLNDNDNELEF
jgi:hypothetical protein|tara:strand:- start:303 stop:740 length:438 start_codon:yes stop_codon:yes gene_type:complete